MLSVYTNKQDLLNSSNTQEVSRFESVDRDLLDVTNYSVTVNKSSEPNLELHVYTPDGVYLTGNHDTLYSIKPSIFESESAQARNHLSIDTLKELDKLGITRGQFKILYNLFDNVIGSYENEKIWIKEISPSRRELRLQLSNLNLGLTPEFLLFKARWEDLAANNQFDSFVLNFGFNETYQIINVRFESIKTTPEILIKLYTPLPSKYGEKAKCWISEEIIAPVLETISIIPKFVPVAVNTIAGPNFELESDDGFSVATDYKSWNDLLTTNLQTSQQLIDLQFSGSLSGLKLNTNFRNFNNFIHFSSAVERVKNFKYKLELIEYFTGRIQSVANISDPVAVINLSDLYTKRNRVVSGFDDFEKYLFFESTGSRIYTHFDATTGSVDPWPKTEAESLHWYEAYTMWSSVASSWATATVSDPYNYFAIQVETTSTTGTDYYINLLEQAEIYDKQNIHKLQNTVPLHIQNSNDGEQFLLFIHMLAQHFDILWSYINELTSIHTREEHPKDGMPNDLLYHVATSMGLNLLNGKSTSDLWKYSLATDASGSALQSAVDGITVLSDESNTKEIWRRLLNNLPYILKSKGTSRSIKALLTCFGIPSTILTIKEYGGPSTFTDNDHYPEYIHEVYHYAWFSETGSLNLPVTQYRNGASSLVSPNTLQFRFKTDSNYGISIGNYYNIFSMSSGSLNDVYNLVLNRESNDDNEGTITLFNKVTGNQMSVTDLEILNDSWHSVILESTNSTASLKVAKSLYGKLIYIKSASYNGDLNVFPVSGVQYINFASGSRTIATPNSSSISTLNQFYGHFHEIRLWSASLNNATIEEHAASPSTYTFNVDRTLVTTGQEAAKPYDHLLQRFTLANKEITSGSLYQSSVHPNQTINTGSLNFIGFVDSGSIRFESFEETYYTPSPSLGGSSLYSNKIRIESASLNSNLRLNTKTRIEKSSYDRYSNDSNRIGVYFSPQTAINEDIFNQLGYFEIDDYIGNPDDIYNDYYTDLNNFAIAYWKKYENRNDFESYFRALEIYDFTLFKYIKRLLPYRVNSIVGLVVEPNVLERNKVKLLRKSSTVENLTHNAIIDSRLHYDINSEFILEAVSILPLPPTIESDVLLQRIAIIDNKFPLSAEVSQIERAEIEVTSTNVNRLKTEWTQNRQIGKYTIRESGSYEPIQIIVLNSRVSTHLKTIGDYYYSTKESASLNIAYSSSLKFAEINNFYGTGNENAKYNGSKLSGPAINVDSANTTDGGPVVKVTKVNPNQIVVSNNQITTINNSITGNTAQSL